MVLLITIITVILLAGGGVEALLLVEINSCEQQSHGQEDEDRDLELVGEKDGADEGGEDVSRGRAVLLHHVVQLLQDGGHQRRRQCGPGWPPTSRTGKARTAGLGNSLQNSNQKTLLVKKTR